jgi:hypothetical protein
MEKQAQSKSSENPSMVVVSVVVVVALDLLALLFLVAYVGMHDVLTLTFASTIPI